MSKKYIAIADCEYQGVVYRTGDSILFEDDVEVCELFWKSEAEVLKEEEASRVVKAEVDRMTPEEKSTKIKDLTKKLKAAEKALKEKSTADK